MREEDIPLRRVCRVKFKNPVLVRFDRLNMGKALVAHLFFWLTTTGNLCYRHPDAAFGFLVPDNWLDEIESVEAIGDPIPPPSICRIGD